MKNFLNINTFQNTSKDSLTKRLKMKNLVPLSFEDLWYANLMNPFNEIAPWCIVGFWLHGSLHALSKTLVFFSTHTKAKLIYDYWQSLHSRLYKATNEIENIRLISKPNCCRSKE